MPCGGMVDIQDRVSTAGVRAALPVVLRAPFTRDDGAQYRARTDMTSNRCLILGRGDDVRCLEPIGKLGWF